MMPFKSGLLWPLAALGATVGFATQLSAFHGLSPVAYGARQGGMGGAFSAIGGSVLDLEGNPAHLGRAGTIAELGGAVSFARLEYDDRYLDPGDGIGYWTQNRSQPVAPFPYAGFVTGDEDFGWGFGVYTQAGGGFVEDLPRRYAADRTLAPRGANLIAQEDVAFRLLHVRGSLGAAGGWSRLRIGATADVIYARNMLDRELRDPTGSVVLPGGIHYRSDPSISFGGKVGLTYDLARSWRIGLAYTPMSTFHLDGELRVDGEAFQPHPTRVSRRMRWPARTTAGVAYESGPWSVGLDLRYIQWASAMGAMRFELEDARVITPIGVPVNSFAMRLAWRDQLVVAAGVERRMDGFALRGGYSYGRTPLTPEGAGPFLGATTEHHLSLGFGIGGSEGFEWNVAAEYGFSKRLRGAPTSDWNLTRQLVFEDGGVRPALFQHSRSTRVLTIYAGCVFRRGST
jgi:long-chain fatty acid transport protein